MRRQAIPAELRSEPFPELLNPPPVSRVGLGEIRLVVADEHRARDPFSAERAFLRVVKIVKTLGDSKPSAPAPRPDRCRVTASSVADSTSESVAPSRSASSSSSKNGRAKGRNSPVDRMASPLRSTDRLRVAASISFSRFSKGSQGTELVYREGPECRRWNLVFRRAQFGLQRGDL